MRGDVLMVISLKEEKNMDENYKEFLYWYGLEDNKKAWTLYNTWDCLGDNVKGIIIYGDLENY